MVDRPAGSVGDPLRDFCLLGGLYMGSVRGWIPWDLSDPGSGGSAVEPDFGQ